MEIADIADLGRATLGNKGRFAEFVKLTRGRDAHAFRKWFHQ